MYLHSDDIVQYVESELLEWISDPVLINTPMLLSEHKSELEINPLPDSRICFNIQFRDNTEFVIQWNISLTKNQDYLPEDTNAKLLMRKIKNVIDKHIHFEDSESEEFSTLDINENITYSQILTLINTDDLAQNLDTMILKEISTEFGSTKIYLDSNNPQESLDEFLKYKNITDVYDIIFDKSLEDELNIKLY